MTHPAAAGAQASPSELTHGGAGVRALLDLFDRLAADPTADTTLTVPGTAADSDEGRLLRGVQALLDRMAEAHRPLELRVVERTRELTALLGAAESLASTLELETLLDLILDQIKVVADYDGAVISVLDEDTVRVLRRRAPPAAAPAPSAWDVSARREQGPPGWEIILRREAAIIGDVRGDEPLARRYRAALDVPLARSPGHYVRAWMSVPLALPDRVFGRITLASARPHVYTDHHTRLVTAFATQAAAAIENARLFAEQRRTAQELTTLLAVAHTVSAMLHLEPLLAVILEQLKVVADYDGCALMLVEGDELQILDDRGGAVRDRTNPEIVGLRIPVARAGVLWEMLSRQESIIIADVRGDTDLAEHFRAVNRALGTAETPATSHVRAWLAVPLVLSDRVIGLIGLSHDQPGYYTARHAALARAIANQAAVAIENARLYNQARAVAVLEERQRLARELHDSVSQVLFGIGLGARTTRKLLDRGDAARAIPSVEYITQLAEMGTAEMRALLFELRPEALAEEGLVAALAKQAAALEARHTLAVALDLGEEPDVSLDAKEVLYRIAQEATHNTVKHARAATVSLSLRQEGGGGGVVLEIRDDGVGFDATRAFPGHLGQRSMHERAERLGGTLTVESASGQGTRITVRLP